MKALPRAKDAEIPSTEAEETVPLPLAAVDKLLMLLPTIVLVPADETIPAIILPVLAVVGTYALVRLAMVLLLII